MNFQKIDKNRTTSNLSQNDIIKEKINNRIFQSYHRLGYFFKCMSVDII